MADSNGATGAQAAPDTQPPAGTKDAATQADASGGTQDSQPETMSLEEAKKLRSEANSLRKRMKEIEDRDLTEAQRIQKELEDLRGREAGWQRERQELQLQMSVTDTARTLGYANPQLAVRLLDHNAVAFDESGKPTNIEQLLKTLLEKEPYLAGGPAPATSASWGAGASGAPSRADDMNQRIRAAARGRN